MFYPQYYYLFCFPIFGNQSFSSSGLTQIQPTPNASIDDSFIHKFLQELVLKHSSSYVKEWSPQEDEKLILLGENCTNWKKLSQEFEGKSAKVCFRRFQKLSKKEEEWPREDEEMIKQLKETGNKTWVQISKILRRKSPNNLNYSAKKIRERYKNYLEKQINRTKWTIQQDLELWRRIEEHGKNWNEVVGSLGNRSSLQIRNRYYKFLEPIAEKIREQLKIEAQPHLNDQTI